MFKVHYKYSACIKISTDQVKILCDPWFTWTQYPRQKNYLDMVGDFDFLYVSHIHPDHYDLNTILELFKKYGEKKILIADWEDKPNYLEKKMKSDGLKDNIYVTQKKIIGDTVISIIPNRTESLSDIDSAIVVSSASSKKSVLNINDCVYNEKLLDKILEIKKELNIEFTLFCLGYTGAGSYPQTYYSPITQKDALLEKANIKKEKFFKRYKKAISKIESINRLPFAGKYVLNGELSFLNKYRGVSDALEIKKIDPNAIVLDDGGNSYFDLDNLVASKQRENPYQLPQIINSSSEYYWREIINFEPSDTLLKRLLFQSIKRAHPKSECRKDCFYSIYTYKNLKDVYLISSLTNPQDKYLPLISFNCNKDSDPLSAVENEYIHSHLFIEAKALFAVLTGVTHWNNYEIGSVFQVRRIPDIYDENMQKYLNFLSLI